MDKQPQKGALWRIMKPVKAYITTAMLLASFSALLLLSSFIALVFALESLLEGVIAWDTIALASGALLASILTNLAAFSASHFGAFRLEQILRTDLSIHLARLPLGYAITQGTGALKKVMLDDVKNLHAFVADTTPLVARTATIPLVSLLLMFYFEWRLAILSVVVLLLGAVAMFFAMRDTEKYREEYDKNQARINAAVIEFIQAMPVVRTFDDGSSSFGRYQKVLIDYRQSLIEWWAQFGTSGRLGMIALSPILTLFSLMVVGLWLYLAGELTFGALFASLLLGTGLADALMPFMWLNNFIRKSDASARVIDSLLSTPALPLSENPKIPRDSSITFENVSFHYEGREESPALENVSFEVPAGTSCAFVGTSGAGKSTAAKLIPRFWDVSEGRILIGGVEGHEIDPSVLSWHVSFVFQDTFLFHDTIFNNLLMARPQATREEVEAAAKAAQIHDFIMGLPEGYETLAGERGANLSGGQRQRITIARAILRQSPIVVLDEATAFADPENEEEIIKALAALTQGKTVIIIAHRLSTIKDVNQIVVFDKGKVQEIGNHETLLGKGGLYAKLWNHYQEAQSWDLQHKGNHA